MNRPLPALEPVDNPRDDRQLQRVLQLTRKATVRSMSMEELAARIPDDWKPGEADVEQFLASLRRRGAPS